MYVLRVLYDYVCGGIRVGWNKQYKSNGTTTTPSSLNFMKKKSHH